MSRELSLKIVLPKVDNFLAHDDHQLGAPDRLPSKKIGKKKHGSKTFPDASMRLEYLPYTLP